MTRRSNRDARRGNRDWERRALEAVSERGRRGGARAAVVRLLAEQSCCLSAQQIHDRLRGRDRSVGIASVYRAIEALEEVGMLQRVEVGERGSRYEPALPGGEHHHHVICDSCGEVSPFSDQPLERAIERLGGRLRHMVKAHEVVIHGVCQSCAPGRGAGHTA